MPLPNTSPLSVQNLSDNGGGLMTGEEIFEKLKEVLVSVFELDESSVSPDALLGDDLDLDSIDAIDLVVKMKEYTPEGKPSIDASIFKEVKTVQDVVDALAKVWA